MYPYEVALDKISTSIGMVIELLRLKMDITDEEFDSVYPERIRQLAKRHWTPVSVARMAAEFLVGDEPGTRVLDIGSGAGKFCMVGAASTRGYFTGVEQRQELVELSMMLADAFTLENVTYHHANITSVEFREYDAFYLYNSFYENVETENCIDSGVRLNLQLYDDYSLHTFEQLASLRRGVRLATYFTSTNIVPPSFRIVDSFFGGRLILWEKLY